MKDKSTITREISVIQSEIEYHKSMIKIYQEPLEDSENPNNPEDIEMFKALKNEHLGAIKALNWILSAESGSARFF